MYLILPVLRLMIHPHTDKTILWYLIGLWLIFQPILATLNKFWGFRLKLNVPLTTGFVCFLILGYLLGEVGLSRGRVILSAVIWATGTLVTIVGTYVLTRRADQFDGFFYDFVSLNVILASAAAFLLLRRISETKLLTSAVAYAVVRSLATTTFGIYLVHVLVLELLRGWIPFLQINSSMANAIWSLPLVSILVFLVSFLIVCLLQKIPILKQIVP